MLRNPNEHELRPRVLLGEDDAEMRSVLSEALREKGYGVVECADGLRVLERLSSVVLSSAVTSRDPENFALIISDIRMPGVNGMSILEGVQLFEHFPPVILITAFGDEETHAEATRLGAAAMFDKPFDIVDLLDKVEELAPIA
ncbi:MAG: response regulator [Thermoguttaceae bacterium]|jgi:CheY-like chemotaxis protein